MAPPDTAAARIDKAIQEASRSHRWVSVQTGIPLSTLNRKLNGHGDFDVSQVAKIARVLTVRPITLLPPEFHVQEEPAPRRILTGIAA